MTIERGPVGGAGELTPEKLVESWEAAAKYCSDRGYKTALFSCANELRQSLAAKAPQGVPTRKIGNRFAIRNNEIVKQATGEVLPEWEPLFLVRARDNLALTMLQTYRQLAEKTNCTAYVLNLFDETIAEFEKFKREHGEWMKQPGSTMGKAFIPGESPTGLETLPVPGPVSDDTIHHGMVPPADEYNLRAYEVEGHWYVDIDIDKAHSGMANGFTLSEAMDSANEMLRHMRNTAIEEGRLPREAAAPKPAPPISEFTPENMPVVTVAGGAPPNASPPSWHRSLAEKAKDTMSEFEKGFPYDAATPAPGAERAAPQVHPNRKTEITHAQARAALQHFVNRHFNNPGEKSRASIPAHQDDDDILLFDYITQREALAAAPPAPQPIETLVHQLTKVTMELEDTLASLGKADSMITKLKDLLAERDHHASAERLPLTSELKSWKFGPGSEPWRANEP